MDDRPTIVVFVLDGRRFAVPLAAVDCAVRAVEVTPLPDAPSAVMGAIDVQGRVIPVVNLRRRWGLPERELAPEDQFLIARAGPRTVALWVDAVSDVVGCPPEAAVAADAVVPGLVGLDAVTQLRDGLVLVPALDRLLAPEETRAVSNVLPGEGSPP